ncbi:NAD(P)-dependent oxidoreductase [Saccharopolyspora sp. NPDC002578]
MPTTAQATVTVIGLGPMGRALAGTLIEADETVAVWNRTPGTASPLLERGAQWANSPAEAIAASPVTLINVVDHDAVDQILSSAESVVEGRSIIGLTSDTPERARHTARLVADRGGRYLDGAIMTPAYTIGTPSASILLSGPRELFAEHQALIEHLATPTWLDDEPGRAAAHDVALLDLFWSTISGFLHATALARAEGISPTAFVPFAHGIREILPAIFDGFAERAEQNRHDDPVSMIRSIRASLAHLISATHDRGLDAAALEAMRGYLDRAERAGHGEDEVTRILETMSRG